MANTGLMAENKSVKITVEVTKRFVVEVKENESIASIMSKIPEDGRFSTGNMKAERLFHGDKKLLNHLTLCDYKIQEDATLALKNVINISVVDTDFEEMTLQVADVDSIQNILDKITKDRETLEGLLYNGQRLDPTRSLWNYGVSDGDYLQICRKENLTVTQHTVQILPGINNADPHNFVRTPAPHEAQPVQAPQIVRLHLPEENRQVKEEIIEIIPPQIEADVGVRIVEQQGLRNLGRPVKMENRHAFEELEIEEVNLVRIEQEPMVNVDAPQIREPELEQVAPLFEAQLVQQPVEPAEEEDRVAPEASPQPVVVNKRKRKQYHKKSPWTHYKKHKYPVPK